MDIICVKNARFFFDGKKMRENVDVTITKEGVVPGQDTSGEVVYGEKLLVMPSFFNAHTHIPMVALRGMHEDMDFQAWLRSVWDAEAKMNSHIFYYLSLLSLAENLRHGNAEVVSMYFNVDDTVRAARVLGTLLHTGPVFIKQELMSDPFEERVRWARRFLSSPPPIVSPVVFIHGLYTADANVLETVKELREEYNVPLHLHVSETREEAIETKRIWGDYPVRVLEREGLLDNTYVVHAGWLTRSELELMKEKNTTLVHCPSSNLKLATHGFFPWKEAHDLNIPVRLGTDSQASNNTQDLFFEMRLAALIHKDRYWDSRIAPVHEVLSAAFGSGWMGVDVSGLRFFPADARNVLPNIVFNGHGDLVRFVFHDSLLYPFPDRVEREVSKAKEKVMNAFVDIYGNANGSAH